MIRHDTRWIVLIRNLQNRLESTHTTQAAEGLQAAAMAAGQAIRAAHHKLRRIIYLIIEGSLNSKLPTIWRVEKQ